MTKHTFAWLPAIFIIGVALMPFAYSAVPVMDSKNGVPTLAPLLQEVTPAVVC